MVAIFPYGSNGMNYILGIQIETRCNSRITKINIADFLTRCKESRSRFFMNSGIYTSADYRVRICSINYSVHLHIGNVVSYYFKWHGGPPFSIRQECTYKFPFCQFHSCYKDGIIRCIYRDFHPVFGYADVFPRHNIGFVG